jgi:hypothetical protein
MSKNLTLKVTREASTDRVESIDVITKSNSFTIASALFKKAYAVNLQGITLTQTVDLNSGLMEDYQLYIPYDLHSEDETDPTDEQKLKTRELVIYFNHFKVNKILTR